MQQPAQKVAGVPSRPNPNTANGGISMEVNAALDRNDMNSFDVNVYGRAENNINPNGNGPQNQVQREAHGHAPSGFHQNFDPNINQNNPPPSNHQSQIDPGQNQRSSRRGKEPMETSQYSQGRKRPRENILLPLLIDKNGARIPNNPTLEEIISLILNSYIHSR